MKQSDNSLALLGCKWQKLKPNQRQLGGAESEEDGTGTRKDRVCLGLRTVGPGARAVCLPLFQQCVAHLLGAQYTLGTPRTWVDRSAQDRRPSL